VALLDERVAAFDASAKRQLAGLLRVKNAVEYEDRLVREAEAGTLVDDARRLCRWAHAIVTPDKPLPPVAARGMIDAKGAGFERDEDERPV